MNRYYILEGKTPVAVELMTWAKWFENNLNIRRVASDELPGDVRISTVFLGMDHAFGRGPALLFETMIFNGPHDGYQERFATWDEAVAGHAVAVALASTPTEVTQ